MAYITLTRMMTLFPFLYNKDLELNPLLALCSMVINPAYYTHSQHKTRLQSRVLQAACWRYLCILDAEISATALQSSIGQHRTTLGHQTGLSLLDDNQKFPNLSYPLQDDVEYALEFARLIEKNIGKNSQRFTANAGPNNQPIFNGMDFLSVINYNWNPTIHKIRQALRELLYSRLWSSTVDLVETREAVIRHLKV